MASFRLNLLGYTFGTVPKNGKVSVQLTPFQGQKQKFSPKMFLELICGISSDLHLPIYYYES